MLASAPTGNTSGEATIPASNIRLEAMRQRKPTGRFFTCQPLSWKIRCTVFLLKSSRCATVRYPNEGFPSIIDLIGAANRASTFGTALVGR